MSDASQGAGWWQASDGKWYPPESHPTAVPPPPPAATAAAPGTPGAPMAPTTPGLSSFQKVTLGGAAAVVLGSFLPWASVTSFFGTISKSGTDGDGVITLVLAVVAGALVLAGKAPVATIVLMVLIGVIAVIDIADVSRLADDELAEVSVGAGLWLVAIGAVVGLVGAVQHRRSLGPSLGPSRS